MKRAMEIKDTPDSQSPGIFWTDPLGIDQNLSRCKNCLECLKHSVDNHGFDISYSSMCPPEDICAAFISNIKLVNKEASFWQGR